MIGLGVDWGGTKLEVIALSSQGQTLLRKRIPTPRDDYHACVTAVRDLVLNAEAEVGETCSVGIGIPGTISPATGLVKNANSIWLNGKPLLQDMQSALNRDVRIQNDANCFAVSESVDGAGEGDCLVVGVILGTGCGAGISIDGKALVGRGGIAGEFGHTPLAPLNEKEFPGNACWCGKRGCLETYISGTGFQRTYESMIGEPSHLSAQEILDLKDINSQRAYEIYCSQLARGLAQIINILDPDVIVLGGGMSNVKSLYKDVPSLMLPYVFTDHFGTPIVPAKHGDSSGVRGAAWLW
jgi:fructokinase